MKNTNKIALFIITCLTLASIQTYGGYYRDDRGANILGGAATGALIGEVAGGGKGAGIGAAAGAALGAASSAPRYPRYYDDGYYYRVRPYRPYPGPYYRGYGYRPYLRYDY